ncbi:MAG: hypothetical protein ABI692_14420 [Terracoccus sp.]
MTSLTHHRPSLGLSPARDAQGREGARRRAVHPVFIMVMMAVLGLLLIGGMVFLDFHADTAGRVPHPVPLPAPSAPSSVGR